MKIQTMTFAVVVCLSGTVYAGEWAYSQEATATSGSISSSSAEAGSTSVSAPSQGQEQGQGQSQGQGQKQQQVFAPVSEAPDLGDQVPPAVAPANYMSTQTCFGSASGAASVAGFGVGGGAPVLDKSCRAIAEAKALYSLVGEGAAIERLCERDEVYDALKRYSDKSSTVFPCSKRTKETEHASHNNHAIHPMFVAGGGR